MQLDLDRMLAQARAGQWSVDDFDWDDPLQGAAHLTPRARREAGLQLVFTAGLERQAARVFGLSAVYADDPRAAAIYRLFEADELRHADAELRLAGRYGVTWRDLPLPARLAFRVLAANFDTPNRALHEMSSATILLFELALDTLLVPVLKNQVDDPIQNAVFRRIDLDESRHLAMDYWLLDQKGELFDGRDMRELLEELDGPSTRGERLRARYRLYRTMVALLLGFGTMTLITRSLRAEITDPVRFERYMARVRAVPRRAPRALDVPAYRMGLSGQQRVIDLIGRIVGTKPAQA